VVEQLGNRRQDFLRHPFRAGLPGLGEEVEGTLFGDFQRAGFLRSRGLGLGLEPLAFAARELLAPREKIEDFGWIGRLVAVA
jgi:hypothetical protein